MRSLLQRLAALGLGLALAVLAGEAGLRLLGYDRTYANPLQSFHATDPVLGYRGRRDFAGRFAPPRSFDVFVAHDAGGFRVQEYAKPEAACGRRVQVYGDSFVWGFGVDQGQVFTDLLNRDIDGVCFANFGVTASGTVLQYTLFEQEGLARLAPGDLILVLFSSNDFADNWGRQHEVTAVIEGGAVRRVPPQGRFQTPLRSFLKEHSYVYNLLSLAWTHLRQAARQHETERAVVQELASSDPRVVVTEHFLREFRERAREHGARFVLAYVPGAAELGERDGPADADAAYRRLVEGMVHRLDLEYLDLLPAFRRFHEEHPEARLLLETDRHWNPRGHALASETIARWLAGGAPEPAPTSLASPR